MHISNVNRRGTSSLVTMSTLSSQLIIILVLLVSASTAIVKQSQSQQSQQQRSDEPSQSSVGPQSHPQSSASSVGYQNHQSPSSSVSNNQQQQQVNGNQPTSYSVSVSSSSSSQPGVGASIAPSPVGMSQQQQQQSASQYNPYSSSMAGNSKLSNGNYVDNLAAAANNPEQSYQAAAQSVNMALANSGIFGPSTGSSGSQYAPLNSASPSSQQQSQLNPLHYFYYPSKESSQQQKDALSNSASSQSYQSAYPSYADQINSALSGVVPEVAASSQDPSYLPQPGDAYGNGQQLGPSQQQQSIPQQHQQQQPQQQNNQPSLGPNFGSGDLFAASNMQTQQQQPQHGSTGGGISFNGPSNGGENYLNSQLGAGSSQHLGGYQPGGGLYSQLGDLSTSNFGNNAGGLASVASYMSPNQQQQHQHQQNQHDIFSGLTGPSGSSQPFSSAASQLSPAAVSPPIPQNSQQTSSLFGQSAGPSSLFNNNQQQQQQQQLANSASQLFANSPYLNSFLTPSQFNQFTNGANQMPGTNQLMGDSSVASSMQMPSVTTPASNSKRFGIGSFIMPMLALAGLSLLIPTMSNIGTAVGRKKRSVDLAEKQQEIAYEPLVNGYSHQTAKEASIGEYMDKIERYYSIYKNAVESDDCLNRLICEFGDAVKNVSGKSAVVTVMEKLVPAWMTGKMHLFKEAALGNKEGKEKCKKYICHSNSNKKH